MKRYPIHSSRTNSTSWGQLPAAVKLPPRYGLVIWGISLVLIVLLPVGWAAAPVTSGSRASGAHAGPHVRVPGGTHEEAEVDLIELNHFIDKDGREVFQQTVFYDWSEIDSRFHVRAWRLVKRDSQLPQRRWDPNHFVCVWRDKAARRLVVAPQMRETWTQQDPERVNRQFLSEDQRTPLFGSKE